MKHCHLLDKKMLSQIGLSVPPATHTHHAAGSPSWSPPATERNILAALVGLAASVRKIAAKFGVGTTIVQRIKAQQRPTQAAP